jgi:arsenate reductase (thioredoxin)
MAQGFIENFDQRLVVRSAGTEASGKLNPKAVVVMNVIGLNISHLTSDSVDMYLGDKWAYEIRFVVPPTKAARLFSER